MSTPPPKVNEAGAWALTGLAWALAGCAPNPAEPSLTPPEAARDGAVRRPGPDRVAPPVAPPPLEVWTDLVAQVERGHLYRQGIVIDPGAPGWVPATRLAGRGPWLSVRRLEDRGRYRSVAYPDGIGASIHFPVRPGEAAAGLQRLSLWMKPMVRGQRVSVFMDEEAVATVEVPRGGRRYRLELPRALVPGEHHLRLYFRKTRFLGRHRTPAALDEIRVLPKIACPPGSASACETTPAPLPAHWVGTMRVAELEGAALLAGPPTAWSWYVLAPAGGHFVARAAVLADAAGPVTFVVRAQVDGGPLTEAMRATVSAGSFTEIDVDLSDRVGRPTRLVLETLPPDSAGSNPQPITAAGWVGASLLVPRYPSPAPPPVKNVIVLAFDSLRADRVRLGRSGDHAATPNLDLLAAEGGRAVDVWSGGSSPAEGHRRLLNPGPVSRAPGAEAGPSLAELMVREGRRTGIFFTSPGVGATLTDSFGTSIDLTGEQTGDQTGERSGEGVELGSRTLLRELAGWMEVRRQRPFFAYVAIGESAPTQVPAGYLRLYERPIEPDESKATASRLAALGLYDAQVSVMDYWIGQVLAALGSLGLEHDTALIVVGSTGRAIGDKSMGLGPDVLHVPLVIWHPGLRAAAARPLARGGDLLDVAPTVAAVVGAPVPDSWAGARLDGALLRGRPIRPRPNRARQGRQIAIRVGAWLLRGNDSSYVGLWDLKQDPTTRDDLQTSRPIALRVLRDLSDPVP